MKFPEQLVEKCLSKERTRYAIQNAMYDAEAGVVYTTNGKVMACVPVEKDAGDVSGIVDPDVVAHARRLMPRYNRMVMGTGLRVKMGAERVEFPNLTSMVRKGAYEKYPDVKVVMESAIAYAKSKPPTLALDIQFLYDLARAVCSNQRKLQLSIWIKEDGSAVMVQPCQSGLASDHNFSDCEPHGVIMPMVLKSKGGA